MLAINYYCTGYAAQALFLQNRHFLVLDDMGFLLYRAGTVLCIHMTRCTFINWLLKLNQTTNELQFTKVLFCLTFYSHYSPNTFTAKIFTIQNTHNYINIDAGIGGQWRQMPPHKKLCWGIAPTLYQVAAINI